jgi:hypothetical protein
VKAKKKKKNKFPNSCGRFLEFPPNTKDESLVLGGVVCGMQPVVFISETTPRPLLGGRQSWDLDRSLLL